LLFAIRFSLVVNSECRTANSEQQTMTDLFNYPPKILLAFGEAIDGNRVIHDWLVKNGYPELGALAYAIRGSDEAFTWLLQNGFPHMAALDSAIDEKPQAYKWLKENNFPNHIVFADACQNKREAVDWFMKNRLQLLFRITQRIRILRDNVTFDYHKLHF
jgi:hypothetical protein